MGTRLVESLRRAAAEFGVALYPPLCWLCRAPSVDGFGCRAHALDSCRGDSSPRCRGCAARLPAGIAAGLCARCRREPRGYARLVAGGDYGSTALREWILAFKHGGRRDLAGPLAAFLAGAWRAAGGPPPGAVLTSVPLHPLRRLERGYDQAWLLGRELAEALGLVCLPALRRRRRTPAQGAPGSRSRVANVEGAFDLRPGPASALAGRAVWLVDDVVTSGATVRACAAVLRRAHATEISVLTLARVELDAPGGDDERGEGLGGEPRAYADGP